MSTYGVRVEYKLGNINDSDKLVENNQHDGKIGLKSNERNSTPLLFSSTDFSVAMLIMLLTRIVFLSLKCFLLAVLPTCECSFTGLSCSNFNFFAAVKQILIAYFSLSEL